MFVSWLGSSSFSHFSFHHEKPTEGDEVRQRILGPCGLVTQRIASSHAELQDRDWLIRRKRCQSRIHLIHPITKLRTFIIHWGASAIHTDTKPVNLLVAGVIQLQTVPFLVWNVFAVHVKHPGDVRGFLFSGNLNDVAIGIAKPLWPIELG